MQPESTEQNSLKKPKKLEKEELLCRLLCLYLYIESIYLKLKPILEPEIKRHNARVIRGHKNQNSTNKK